MADILIKGMEMPKSCYYCPIKNDGYYLCKATRPYKELEDDCKECKPQWCPLVPVPPHGDLIDINTLKLAIVNVDYVNKHDYLKGVLNAINNAPTVIPASGKE